MAIFFDAFSRNTTDILSLPSHKLIAFSSLLKSNMSIAQFHMNTSFSTLLTVNDSSLVPHFIHSFSYSIILRYYFSYNEIQINSHIIIQERRFYPAASSLSSSHSTITTNPALSNVHQKKILLLTIVTIFISVLSSIIRHN